MTSNQPPLHINNLTTSPRLKSMMISSSPINLRNQKSKVRFREQSNDNVFEKYPLKKTNTDISNLLNSSKKTDITGFSRSSSQNEISDYDLHNASNPIILDELNSPNIIRSTFPSINSFSHKSSSPDIDRLSPSLIRLTSPNIERSHSISLNKSTFENKKIANSIPVILEESNDKSSRVLRRSMQRFTSSSGKVPDNTIALYDDAIVISAEKLILCDVNNKILSNNINSVILGGSKNNISSTLTPQHNNIIIGAQNNLILDSSKCISFGDSNKIIDSQNTIVSGVNNKCKESIYCHSSGENNNIDNSMLSYINSGESNSITNSSRTAILSGSDNIMQNSEGSVAIGGYKTFVKYSINSYCSGKYNTILNSPLSNMIGGKFNKILDSACSTIISSDNSNIKNNSKNSTIISGKYSNIINANNSINLAGNGLISNIENSVNLGTYNESGYIEGSPILLSVGNGTKNKRHNAFLVTARGEVITDVYLSPNSGCAHIFYSQCIFENGDTIEFNKDGNMISALNNPMGVIVENAMCVNNFPYQMREEEDFGNEYEKNRYLVQFLDLCKVKKHAMKNNDWKKIKTIDDNYDLYILR